MGKLATLPAELNELKRTIVEHYWLGIGCARASVEAKQEAVVHAFIVGRAASQARAAIPGDTEFGHWLEEAAVSDRGQRMDRRKVWRCMELYRAHAANLPLLTSAVPNKGNIKLLSGEIETATGGKTLHQLELDLGLRKPRGKRPQKPPHAEFEKMTPKERRAAAFLWATNLRIEINDMLSVHEKHLDDDSNHYLIRTFAELLDRCGALFRDGRVMLEGEPANALDDNVSTFWHSQYSSDKVQPPHHLIIDFGKTLNVASVIYTPRADMPNGRVKDYEIYLSEDEAQWGEPAAKGTMDRRAREETIKLSQVVKARFMKFVVLNEQSNQPFGSVAELDVVEAPGQ